MCCSLTTAEVTVCIHHYMDMCPVVAQRAAPIDFIYFATKELLSNNIFCYLPLATRKPKLGNSLYYSLLRDFWRCPCPLPKVSATKNPRDTGTHGEKHQLGSNESISTFPKACRFTYLPQLQRPQLSMQKARRHLVPVSPTLSSATSTAPQAWVSRTSNHQPPRAVFRLGRQPILILPPTSCHQVEILAAYTSNCISVLLSETYRSNNY